MGMNARMTSNDPRLYNPSRDVAHHFVDVAKEVVKRVEHPERWPALQRHLEQFGITDEQLGLACKAFVDFTASAVQKPEETMQDALKRVGWDDVQEDAILGVMGVLGSIMMGIYWTGCRETTMGGEGPGMDAQKLVSEGTKIATIMTIPRWRRGLYRRWCRVRAAWKAATDKDG